MSAHELDITLQAGTQVEHVKLDEHAVELLLDADNGNAAVFNFKEMLRMLMRRVATEKIAAQQVTDYLTEHVTESS